MDPATTQHGRKSANDQLPQNMFSPSPLFLIHSIKNYYGTSHHKIWDWIQSYGKYWKPIVTAFVVSSYNWDA